MNLYQEAYKLYKAAELNIDLVKEWIEESDDRDIINSMLDKMYDYKEEVEELSSKALYLYNIAVEKNDSEAAQLILDAQEKLKNASDLLYQISDLIAIGAYNDASQLLGQVAMLISDAKQDLMQAANKLNVMWSGDDYGDDESDDENGSDSHGDDSNSHDGCEGDECEGDGSNHGGGMNGGDSGKRNGDDGEDDEE